MTEQTEVIAAISDPGRLAIDFGFPEPLASERQMAGEFCRKACQPVESLFRPAVEKIDGPLVIENVLEHPIYRNVQTVESLGVHAYLGVPLVTSTGHAIGSFCAVDFKPRAWTKLDIEVLQELAASSMREIELRMALHTLNDERRRLDVLLQHIPAGIVFGEAPSGRIVIRNRHAEQIIGEAVIASATVESYSEWVGFRADGNRVEPAQWPLAKALRGEIVRNEEVLYQRRDGSSVWIRLHAAPVRDAGGTILGGIVAFYDIDEERAMRMENVRLYEEARRANRAKDEFFAAVTHELRTPMTAIIGWARLLKMEQLDNSNATEAANAITDSAMLQAQLVDDLLDVSRIATGKLSLHREPIDINEVARQAVQAVQPAAESNGLRLRVSLGGACVIDADRARIRQIVGNLLSNAIKFTPAGGLIELISSVHDGFATLVVRDTGRGVEASILPHIFERFQQAESAELGGLGLGLTIVRHLVAMHGGDVRAESEGAGKGATFTVRLPLAARV